MKIKSEENAASVTMSKFWWALPLGVFVVSRVVATLNIIFHLDSYKLDAILRSLRFFPESNSFFANTTTWDGQWYWKIAVEGYPTTLPLEAGEVTYNAWAFFPLWPFSVRALMEPTGLSFPVAALILSLAFSSLAMVLLYRLLRESSNVYLAILPIVFLSFGPGNFVYGLAYSESLAFLLVVLALWSLRRKRWLPLFVLITLIAFTRPVVLPLSAVIGIVWLLRVLKRKENPLPRRESFALLAASFYSALSFGYWPLTAALFTDHSNGFLETQEAWQRYSVGSWFKVVTQGVGGAPDDWRLLVIVLIPLMASAVLLPTKNGYPIEVRLWGFFYLLYTFMVLASGSVDFTNAGMGRYFTLALLPLLPFPWLVASLDKRWQRIGFGLAVGAIVIGGSMASNHLIEHNLIEKPSRGTPI